MKIAYCVYQLGWGGGIERVLTSKVNWFVDHGHEVMILICLQNDNCPSLYGIDPRVRILNANIHYGEDFDKPLHKRMLHTWARMRQHKRWMKDILMRERFDVVVTTHMVETSFLPSIKDGSKKILELHTSALSYQKEKHPPRWSLRQLLVKCYEWRDHYNFTRFDAVGCLTQEDYILRGKPKNMVIIPNPLPFDRIPLPATRDKIVLAVGRFSKEKNFIELLEIWDKARKNHPLWKLWIVGDGPQKATMVNKVISLGMEDQVEILPYAHEILPYYRRASIYVMTSLFEGMPMALLESQACGLPIVSYACPCGPRDIVTDGQDGYLVRSGDMERFAQCLTCLMSDERLRQRMEKEAFTNSARFMIGYVMDAWLKVFAS